MRTRWTGPLRIGLAAVASGVIAALPFPPYGLWWAAPLALLPILALLQRMRGPLGGALVGLLFAAGWSVAVANWLYPAAQEFDVARRVALAAALAVAVSGASAFVVFGALAILLRRGRLPFALGQALAWVSAEWLRLAGPFPWLRLGDALFAQTLWLQPAAVGGVPLLSFGIALVGALLLQAGSERRRGPLAWAVAVVVLWAAFGAARLAMHPPGPATLSVGLVQAATPQQERWQSDSWRPNLERQLALAEGALADGAELLFWSETAIDAAPDEIGALAPKLSRLRAPLVTGLLLQRPDGRLTNSIAGFDPDGGQVARYDKIALFPLVEEIPAWIEQRPRLRRSLRRLAAASSYARGESSAPIEVAGHRLGALVCYEAMFPELPERAVAAGADVLVNLSNDAFFPDRGAAQHGVMARLRSVELGRPLVRVANRGEGFVVDGLGRELARVGRDVREARVVRFDPSSIETLYARGGRYLDEVLVALALLGCLPRGGRPKGRPPLEASGSG